MARALRGALDLAWRKKLRKTRAVMFIPSPIRTRLIVDRSFLGSAQGRCSRYSAPGRHISRATGGRRAQSGRELTAILGFSMLTGLAMACSDDEPAPRPAPTGSVSMLDASVRDLPGEGQEPTPESDTDSRQREPIGPQRLNDEIEGIRNDLGNSYGNGSGPDASPDTGDAGTD
jgi:hypothetical protein